MKKLNCWEYKKCRYHSDRSKASNSIICPAIKEKRLNGVNGGKNGGRACWAIPATLCGIKQFDSFSQKANECMNCSFYQLVIEEESDQFQSTLDIWTKLS